MINNNNKSKKLLKIDLILSLYKKYKQYFFKSQYSYI